MLHRPNQHQYVHSTKNLLNVGEETTRPKQNVFGAIFHCLPRKEPLIPQLTISSPSFNSDELIKGFIDSLNVHIDISPLSQTIGEALFIKINLEIPHHQRGH